MPDEFVFYGKTWEEKNPFWEMKLWMDKNLPKLINEKSMELCNNYSELSDLIRYEILFKYGGIYLDCDFECFKPIDELVKGLSIFASTEDNKHICGGFIGSIPKHPRIKQLIDNIPDSLIKSEGKSSDLRIGPTFVTKNLKGTEIVILDKEYFYPYLPGQIELKRQLGKNKKAYAAHHWAGSWIEKKKPTYKRESLRIPKISIIIPYKKDIYDPKGVREKNYNFVVDRYQKMFPRAEIVIGEDKIGDDIHFCRSSAINDGIKKSVGNMIIISDSDLIISKENLLRGLKEVENYGFVIPWGRCYDISQDLSNKFISTGEIDWYNVKKPNLRDIRDIRKDKLAGGIQIILRNVFNNLGGYNEEFYGWGYEDSDFCMRIKEELGDYKIFEDEKIIHLWHPRLYPNLKANRELYNKKHPEYQL
jgi:hypothetical protein